MYEHVEKKATKIKRRIYKYCRQPYHQELARRKKKSHEFYQAYIYKMLEIAAQADVDTRSVIRYIVEGIQDDAVSKTVLQIHFDDLDALTIYITVYMDLLQQILLLTAKHTK